MGGRREGQGGERRHAVRVGVEERLLAGVPGLQHLRIGQAADQAGMDQAGEAHARDVARLGEHALEVPDRLLRLGEVLVEEAAAVLLGEEAVEAPLALGLGADVEQVDHQQVAGLGALDADRAGQEVDDRQVDVAHVVGGIVVLDEAAGPVVGLDDEVVAGLDRGDHRDVGVPAVVDHVVVVGRLRQIDLDQRLGHVASMLPSRRGTRVLLLAGREIRRRVMCRYRRAGRGAPRPEAVQLASSSFRLRRVWRCRRGSCPGRPRSGPTRSR